MANVEEWREIGKALGVSAITGLVTAPFAASIRYAQDQNAEYNLNTNRLTRAKVPILGYTPTAIFQTLTYQGMQTLIRDEEFLEHGWRDFLDDLIYFNMTNYMANASFNIPTLSLEDNIYSGFANRSTARKAGQMFVSVTLSTFSTELINIYGQDWMKKYRHFFAGE